MAHDAIGTPNSSAYSLDRTTSQFTSPLMLHQLVVPGLVARLWCTHAMLPAITRPITASSKVTVAARFPSIERPSHLHAKVDTSEAERRDRRQRRDRLPETGGRDGTLVR